MAQFAGLAEMTPDAGAGNTYPIVPIRERRCVIKAKVFTTPATLIVVLINLFAATSAVDSSLLHDRFSPVFVVFML